MPGGGFQGRAPDSEAMLVILAEGAVDTANAPISSGISGVVAVMALVFAILALLAWRRRPNRGLVWVAAAFFVFAVKNVFSSIMVTTHFVEHDDIELVLSLCDLVILVLLFVPLVFRRRA